MTGTKVTYFINDAHSGWTESYFLATSSTGFVAEQPLAVSLALFRATLLGAQGYIVGARYSDLSGGRLAFTDYSAPTWPKQGGGSSPFSVPPPSDFSDTAILMQLVNNDFKRFGRRSLRGNWDEAVTDGGKINPTSAWLANYASFVGKLQTPANGWNFVAKGTGSWIATVASVGQNPLTGQATITMSLPIDPVTKNPVPPPAVGSTIEIFISGVSGASSINGLNLVTVTSNAIALNVLTVRRVAVNIYLSQGKASYRALQLYPIQFINNRPGRVGERKAGAVFPRVPGRRKARVRG